MKTLLFFIFFTLSWCTHAESRITVIAEGQTVDTVLLADGAHLADLLYSSQLPANINWRSAQIATGRGEQNAQARKAQLLEDLKSLQVYWMHLHQGGLVQSTQQLLRELDQIPVTGRLALELDPDKIRISTKDNQILEGQYVLFVAPRRPIIFFQGLINGRSQQALLPGAGLADYWQGYDLLAGADQGEAYLIQTTGEISRVPVASWNERHREPMAGATLFVGFDPKLLPTKYRDINIRIANMIAERVPE